MKIFTLALILVIITAAVLSVLVLDRVTPVHASPVLVTGGGNPARPGEAAPKPAANRIQPNATPASPVIEVAVGLVSLVFGVIALTPLIAGKPSCR